MNKKYFTLLFIFFVISQSVIFATVPVVLSTDTGTGAHWYRLKNVRAESQGRAAYLKGTDYDVNAVLADYVESDNFLWCFVADAVNGDYQIYNKALLADGARLISFWGTGNGFAKMEKSSTTWGYSWALKDDGGAYGLLPGTSTDPGSATNSNYLHGGLDGSIIFYGHAATEGGSAWIFEDAAIAITVDFSQLTTLITNCSNQLQADKADSQKATKYADAITIYETTIALAQSVADNTEATQADVNSAVVTLKKASNDYRLGCMDLPFIVSEGANKIWYRVLNIRRGSQSNAGYLTFKNNTFSTAALNGSDEQLWAFKGNNVTGVSIYNKANLENGMELIYLDNAFKMSSDSWTGIWKVDSRADGSSTYYGICNTKGVYDSNFIPNDFIHGALDGGLLFYGFGDSGSLWSFEPATINAVEGTKDLSTIYAFVSEGDIYVRGAVGMATIISMTGKKDFFDTKKPYHTNSSGLYIVLVNNIVCKVIIP